MDVLIEYLIKVLFSVIVLLVAKIIGAIFYKSILRFSKKNENFQLHYKKSLKSLIGVFIYTIAIFIIISIFFQNVGPFLAGLGVGGIIIAFAVQEPLANFICGLLIIFTKLIVEGEAIEISGTAGIVDSIGINHVTLKTFDGKSIVIPGKKVWSSEITHYWPSEVRRNELKIGVSYSSDLNKVLEVLNDVFQSSTLIEKSDDLKPAIVFSAYDSSSINFTLRFWAKKENFLSSSMDIAKLIKIKFAENNIEIPFNQLDVNLKK